MNQSDPTAGDYYSRLGISPDADKTTVRKAGKKATSQYHPDNDHVIADKELYFRLKSARDALETPQTRSEYDVFYFYDEEHTAYTTNLYERWLRLNKPKTAERWLADQYDSDEADSYNNSDGLGDDASDAEIAAKKEWLDADEEIDWTLQEDDEGQTEDGNGEQEDQDSNDDRHDSDDPTEDDSEDTDQSSSTPADPKDSGLSDSDLQKIRNKPSLKLFINQVGNASYDSEDESIIFRDYDLFYDKIKLDLNNGKLNRPRKDGSQTPPLKDVSIKLCHGLGSLHVKNERTDERLVIKLASTSSSSDEESSNRTDDKKGNPNKRDQEISYNNPKPEKDISWGSDDDGGSGKDTSDSNGLLYGAIGNIVAIGGIFLLLTTISAFTSLEFELAVALAAMAGFFIIVINIGFFVVVLPILMLFDKLFDKITR